jgi:hypothetical protein
LDVVGLDDADDALRERLVLVRDLQVLDHLLDDHRAARLGQRDVALDRVHQRLEAASVLDVLDAEPRGSVATGTGVPPPMTSCHR